MTKTTATVTVTEKSDHESILCPCCGCPTIKMKRGSTIRHCVLSTCKASIRVNVK